MTTNKHLPSGIQKLSKAELIDIYHVHVEEYQAASKRIAELEVRIRELEKPQFGTFDSECEFSGGYFYCVHCSFTTRIFKDRDKHALTCEKRKLYLSGNKQANEVK